MTSRVVTVSGVSAEARSRLITSQELKDICCRDDMPPVTYIQESPTGCLPTAAAAARLAPHLPARSLLLERAGGAGLGAGLGAGRGTWLVRAALPVPPGAELRLWFAEDVLAMAGFPFLTPYNIRGKKDYVCHECGEQFEEPNPLKVHLFLSCKPFSPCRFWEEIVRRVERTERETAAAPLPEGAVRAEALAAWWARATGGATGGATGRHRCLYCGKLYSRAYGLKIHVRTHTGYKPLRCPHCARPFGDPSNLNKHVRLHSSSPGGGDTPHACALCGRRHARRRDLLRHLRADHDTVSTVATPTPTPTPTPAHTEL